MSHNGAVGLRVCRSFLNNRKMGLNYTDGCVNFRDVGEYLELISGEPLLPHGRILRGGSIDHVKNWKEIGQAATIINLRNGEDYQQWDIDYLHFPMANKIEKYDTTHKEVRRWLNQILRSFENPDLRYPALIHCLSGKDRTGIVVAALLLILGIDREIISEEYLLSEGKVERALIEQSINGMMPLEAYYKDVDFDKVRKSIQIT